MSKDPFRGRTIDEDKEKANLTILEQTSKKLACIVHIPQTKGHKPLANALTFM